jgi:hypothetical protein
MAALRESDLISSNIDYKQSRQSWRAFQSDIDYDVQPGAHSSDAEPPVVVLVQHGSLFEDIAFPQAQFHLSAIHESPPCMAGLVPKVDAPARRIGDLSHDFCRTRPRERQWDYGWLYIAFRHGTGNFCRS